MTPRGLARLSPSTRKFGDELAGSGLSAKGAPSGTCDERDTSSYLRIEALRIGDLVVSLPPDLAVEDGDNLERHLRPFACAADAPADVVVERSDGFADDAPLPPGSFRVELNRRPGAPESWAGLVRPYLLTESEHGIVVRGAMPDALGVVAAVHLGLVQLLPRRGGLMLHASGVRAAGGGFVFPGPSGTGKTTAAERFDGGMIVADERCIVRKLDGRWRLYGTPMWGGKYGPGSPEPVPLAMVVLVRKNAPLGAAAVASACALGRLTPSIVHHRYDGPRADRVLGTLAALASEVPVVELSFDLDLPFGALLVDHAARVGLPVPAVSRGRPS